LIIKIKECSAFIGNDSGPIYIASLLDKPTFTLFGPTNPEFSLSSGEHHRYIAKSLKCSPAKNTQYCFTQAGQNGCPAFECMNLLGLDEVNRCIRLFLEENKIVKVV
jgi:ADP-heptose:LPS heptosyltransferase